jgi:hypothetical protein
MPSTIPYDKSLVLGNIVHPDKLDNLIKMSEAEAPADAAEANLNSLIALKRSIDMSVQEMIDMGISPEDLIKESQQIEKDLQEAAVAYGKAKIDAEKTIQPLRAKLSGISKAIESPIDYNRSALKTMGIGTHSLQMNVQYFSFDRNQESSSAHATTVASFVSESLSLFGHKQATEATASVQKQTNAQTSRHSIEGTLVLSITCTHKNAQVFAPFYLDVDKAVRAFNALFPSDMIKTNDPGSIAAIEAKSETILDKSFQVLSGASYGSSFVGMVHVLNTSTTASSQSMESIATSLQEKLEIGAWFAHAEGGFGVNDSFSNSAKNLLSTANVQSHCSLVTMGIIPSIKSNALETAVKGLSDSDPAADMEKLSTLQGATATEQNTIASSANAARTGQQMISLKTTQISSVLSGLSEIDRHSNQILDVNSVMTAMDDYISKCIEGGDNLGVPINYYLKPITQSMIARAWLAKYYPNRYNQAGSADDSESGGPTGGGGDAGGGDA